VRRRRELGEPVPVFKTGRRAPLMA
jgi:hypothetical protein